MKLQPADPCNPEIIGKAIYDAYTGRYLGVLQLSRRDTVFGGCWITVRVEDVREIAILHKTLVLIEDHEEEQRPGPDNPEPVAPDVGGYPVTVPGSHGRGKGTSEQGSSWSAREGLGDEDETDDPDPLIYPDEEAAAASDDAVRDRQPTTVHEPDGDITAYPAGGPLGRSTHMGLEQTKAQLAGAADQLTRDQGQIGTASERFSQARIAAATAERMTNETIAVHNYLISELEQVKSRVIVATVGHGVQAPADALLQIDLAIQKLTETRTALLQASNLLKDTYTALGDKDNDINAAGVNMRTAADIINRYRTSF